MTRRRWIADEVTGDRAALVEAHADHLVRVLRARVGQEFDISAGGRVRRGRIASVTPQRVEFELAEDVPASAAPQIHLYLAVFKFDRFEWAVEKATELGAARIVPVIARRTDSHLAAAAAKRAERWRRIAREAAEQSRRTSPPEIAEPVKLKAALAGAGGTRIVLAESEQGTTLKDALASAAEPVLLAIGPEGGWTSDELRQFTESGWISSGLGPTVLRAETAAVAAVAIAVSELATGD
ncbi:MAG: 16S rRNA (uracil(1498)-N(3))-methyltransferase [Acidobacteriia bacterium]|nr:16S rRNA (uracil(1498)-N(3))-methyltransferase [Terriglobia bacterium]